MSILSSKTAEKSDLSSEDGGFSGSFQNKSAGASDKTTRLYEEIERLRSQLDEYSNMGEKLEQLGCEKESLASRVRSLQSEKDELSRRIEICLQTIEDLKSRAEEQKNPNCSDQRASKIDELQNAIKEEKQNSRDLSGKVSNLKEKLKEEQQKSQTSAEELSRVIASAEKCFHSTFSAESLSNHLSTFSMPTSISEIPSCFSKSDAFNDQLSAALKKSKKKIREQKSLCSAAEQKATELEASFKIKCSELEGRISMLNSQIDNSNQNKKLLEAKYSQELAAKDAQIQTLAKSLEKTRQIQEKPLESPQKDIQISLSESKIRIDSLENQVKEQSSEIETYKKQARSAQKKLHEAATSRDSLLKELKAAKSEIDDRISEVAEAKCQKNTLELERTSLQEQIRAISARLQEADSNSTKSKEAVSEKEAMVKNFKASMSLLETSAEKQKKEIRLLYSERDSLMSACQKQESLIDSFEKKFETMENELISVRRQPKEERVSTESQRIPFTSWVCPEFPRDLCVLINETAKNEALPTSIKLRQVLAVISSFYNQKIKEAEKIQEDIRTKDGQKDAIVDEFLKSLGEAISETLSIKDILSSNKPSQALSKINSLVYDTNKASLSKETDSFLPLLLKLEANNPDGAVKSVESLLSRISELSARLDDTKSKNKLLKAAIKEVESQGKKQISDLKSSLQAKDDIVKKIEEEKSNLASDLHKCQAETINMQNEIQKLRQEHGERINERDGDQQRFVSEMKARFDCEKASFANELRTKDAILQEQSIRIKKMEKDIAQWKQATAMLKEKKKDSEAKLVEAERNCSDKVRLQSKDVEAKYEKLIEEIKQKNYDALIAKDQIEKMLKQCEDKLKLSDQELSRLSLEKQQLSEYVESMKEDVQRERHLIETKSKAAQLSGEMKFRSMTEDMKADFGLEKRRIFGYFANQFRQFFDAKHELQEESFKAMVQNVKAEFDRQSRQEASLRRLLGISASQPLEETVSRLLLSLCQP